MKSTGIDTNLLPVTSRRLFEGAQEFGEVQRVPLLIQVLEFLAQLVLSLDGLEGLRVCRQTDVRRGHLTEWNALLPRAVRLTRRALGHFTDRDAEQLAFFDAVHFRSHSADFLLSSRF